MGGLPVDLAIEAFSDDRDYFTRDIERIIESSPIYDNAINAMNGAFPSSIRGYAVSYGSQNLNQTDADINRVGQLMTPGQVLFHGGVNLYDEGARFITTRPFSTTLAPSIAIMQVHYKSKAYNGGRMVLYVLSVADNSNTKAFVYPKPWPSESGGQGFSKVSMKSCSPLVRKSKLSKSMNVSKAVHTMNQTVKKWFLNTYWNV